MSSFSWSKQQTEKITMQLLYYMLGPSPHPCFFMKIKRVNLVYPNNKTTDLGWCSFIGQVILIAGTCPFVSGPSEVWAAAGAVMSGALRGQDRNYWTEGGWQRELALGANRCCNHKEIHNLWIKYEERGQQEWRVMVTLSQLLGQ